MSFARGVDLDIATNRRVAAGYLGFQHEGASEIYREPSCPAKAGHPVIRGIEIRSLAAAITGSSAFADDDVRKT
jgi:hypothetical protein